MDVHASEQEQIEALKKWWKENGSSLIVGVLLGLSALLGAKAWFGYRETQAFNASGLYMQMLAEMDNAAFEPARKLANEILSNYDDTGYTVPAALALARMAVEEGDTQTARTHLTWVLEHADNDTLRHTARQRLVRLMIDAGDFAGAQAQLAAVDAAGAGVYGYGYSVLRGDLALAQDKPDEARAAYKAALDAAPAQASDGELVRMKYENLLARSENAAPAEVTTE